jgi:hypothetical protein
MTCLHPLWAVLFFSVQVPIHERLRLKYRLHVIGSCAIPSLQLSTLNSNHNFNATVREYASELASLLMNVYF